MGGFDRDSMKAWYALLPQDVASSMEPPGDEDVPSAADLAEALGSVTSGGAAVDLVGSRPEDFIGMGRARRIRFLAWLSARDYPDRTEAVIRLTDVDASSGEGEAGGIGKVAPYFKEDVRALVESLGPRAAKGIVDGATLAAVMGAAYQAAGELDMRSGGGI